MPLRIAFDLDGVLADMEGALVEQAEGLFGKAMTARLLAESAPESTERSAADSTAPENTQAADVVESAAPIAKLHLTVRQERRLWSHIKVVDNFWESLKEIEPGVIARLNALAADRRWEVIFLTKRPASGGATSQVQTQRWLEARGFTLPSVYVVQGNRGRIASALDLDFVIDDRHENCLNVVVESKARAILVWREDEKQLPAAARRLGIGVVKTVDECLAILSQLDGPDGAQTPGVVERFMRLLGLKEPARA